MIDEQKIMEKLKDLSNHLIQQDREIQSLKDTVRKLDMEIGEISYKQKPNSFMGNLFKNKRSQIKEYESGE